MPAGNEDAVNAKKNGQPGWVLFNTDVTGFGLTYLRGNERTNDGAATAAATTQGLSQRGHSEKKSSLGWNILFRARGLVASMLGSGPSV